MSESGLIPSNIYPSLTYDDASVAVSKSIVAGRGFAIASYLGRGAAPEIRTGSSRVPALKHPNIAISYPNLLDFWTRIKVHGKY